MTRRERLEAVFSLEQADRTPILGGWIAAPGHIMELTGTSRAQYWHDPVGVSIEAYHALGVDGLIDVFVPKDGDYRCVDHENFFVSAGRMTLEEALADIEALPDANETERQFDLELEYANFRDRLVERQAECGDMLWMPAQWDASSKIAWYGRYGYENFFYVVGAYPEHARKLMEVGGARGRCQSLLLARAVREGIYPSAVLLGEDICDQNGPMVSPAFLQEYFAPQLEYAIEPLLDVGCRPVWHSDGDVRRILDILIGAGIQGFQGFQSECGVLLEDLVRMRTRDGDPLLIFGPLSVTTELPVLDEEAIAAKVDEAIETCRGRASLVLFTANTINPDIPLANVVAMSRAVGAIT
ncbi:MAG: hypothetical protein ACC655_06510 [Rhodothermia bacterium]